jgi:hypothetical protein
MLCHFQHSFSCGLLEHAAPEAGAAALQLDPLRYGVHVQNTRVSLRKVLEDVFPVTRRLVGIDFFAAMAGQFVALHPPAHGWLSAYGEGFPDFVGQYPPAADLGYLSDISRIEWARVRAANAPDDPGLDLNVLAGLEPKALTGLILNLHIAASVIRSRFPVFAIWQAHQYTDGDAQLAQIDLAEGPDNILISRPSPQQVEVYLLSSGDDAFLAALAERAAFHVACQAAVRAEVDYDLGVGLGDLVFMRALAALDGAE